ncbi:cytochrome b/b6 domain-containing protein [Tropicimonas sp. TH_r6]|uniref:cytochrome b/b6 domain-containing protein n=1 Tax=Tropicimonas sp. TH_r6 TaxID=3082085 RepID=UPI002954FB77|nr:cytochrome b/b6 domain-containing protein [Tropicimonas sp. TH_r6]MDV7143018.1 cytochrome b/b6 domain-containing protein [Tropicimonas sp. TH_r6]
MTDATAPDIPEQKEQVRVWDIWVRLFHWSLVACISAAAVTGFLLGASWIALHIAAGLAAVALVLARIVWGFFGPTHARFADFLRTPSEILSHLKGKDAGRHLGHNPAGGLMMLALMAVILMLGMSGLVGLGGALRTGPLLSLPYATGEVGLELHETLAVLLLVMVLAHVAAAIFESRRSRENLVRSMVTGTKESRPGDHTSYPVQAHPRIAILLIAILAGTAVLLTEADTQTPMGVPVAELDETFMDECTACHLAYHPSLLSGTEWRSIMADLEEHYGEDASFDTETTKQITDWLLAHDASNVQTRPAHLFAGNLRPSNGSMTETRAWNHLHEDVSNERFLRAPVYSQANCSACHKDAEAGWFSPFHIRIPKETSK